LRRGFTRWREIVPLASAAAAAPFGAMILHFADPVALRWLISGLVFIALAVLVSGWRYRGDPHPAMTVAVGLVAGLLGGSVQISGPPVLVFWLGQAREAMIARANLIVYFTLFSAISIFIYVGQGLLSAEVIALALLVGPVHGLAMLAGARLFRLTSERTYRLAGYVIIAAAGIAGMPVLDRFVGAIK